MIAAVVFWVFFLRGPGAEMAFNDWPNQWACEDRRQVIIKQLPMIWVSHCMPITADHEP